MNGTKKVYASVGIMGPSLSLIVWLLNKWSGISITGPELSGFINAVMPVVGMLSGVYGRYRATKRVEL